MANLIAKVGRNANALAAHWAVLAAREAMAAEPGADATLRTEVGRSLTAVGIMLEVSGKVDEAEADYRRSESLLAARADPTRRRGPS